MPLRGWMLHRTIELYFHKIDTPEIQINKPTNNCNGVYDFAIGEQHIRIPAHLFAKSKKNICYHMPRA